MITPYFEKDLLDELKPAGECIAARFYDKASPTKERVVSLSMGWYESPAHRKIMTDPSLKKGAIGLAVADELVDVRLLSSPWTVREVMSTNQIVCFIGR
ncbi:MAG TPA: CAP domain-containing protein [Clostridia bacterium]|nr:CAP domain-containing protein [Clostridia bacterium]